MKYHNQESGAGHSAKLVQNGTAERPFSRADIHEGNIEAHLERIHKEFKDGFEFLKKYPRSVTIFGSSKAKPADEHYRNAETLAKRIVEELGYAVITGGGPGVMEAANDGAFEAKGDSIGLNISIPHERVTNRYTDHAIKFTYFFARKTMLAFAAEAYVFFPGGFGTMDELFGILTLIQTQKIPRVPIILFGSEYWSAWRTFLTDTMMAKYHAIDDSELKLFEITDSTDRAVEVIRAAPTSDWWRNIN